MQKSGRGIARHQRPCLVLCLILALVGVCLDAIALDKSDADSGLWDHYLTEVRQALQSGDWYLARQTMDRMAQMSPQTYERDRIDATYAWVCRNQHNWETAYKHYQQLYRSGMSPTLQLEYADTLMRTDRFETALDVLKKIPARKLSPRERRQRLKVKGRCFEALGSMGNAIGAYSALKSGRGPQYSRMAAYAELARLYYVTGNKRLARVHAGTLQSRWPASDAALASIDLQRAFERDEFMNETKRLERFAWVCYRNREYEQSDRYYSQ